MLTFVYREGIDKVAAQIVQCVLLLTVLGLSGGVIVRSSSFCQEILTVSENGRFPSLDGMLGILALSVFVHHTAFHEEYFYTGIWNIDIHSLNFMVGKVGVAVFFMITGLLFWSKAIRATGRMNVLDLYDSRIWRLYPMIVFLLLVFLPVNAWQPKDFRSHFASGDGNRTVVDRRLFGYPVITERGPRTTIASLGLFSTKSGFTSFCQWSLCFLALLDVRADWRSSHRAVYPSFRPLLRSS
jgi:hypothetical protein